MFDVGSETSTLPTAGTPSASTDVLTKGYADTTYATKGQAAGINFVQNTNGNADAELNQVTAYSLYDDGSSARPVDGTGGVPSTITFAATNSTPLRGSYSFLLTKSAADGRGEGVSVPFTVERADRSKLCYISFDYEITSGTYAPGSSSTDSDLIVYIYDVTNSTLIEPSGFKISGAVLNQQYKHANCSFQTSATGSSYRLIFHVATTTAVAWNMKIDQIQVGPVPQVVSTPVTDWVSSTHSGSISTNATYIGRSRRVGDMQEQETTITFSGVNTQGAITINIANGYSIDTTKLISTTNNNTILGVASYRDASAAGSGDIMGLVRYASATTVDVVFLDAGTANNCVVGNTSTNLPVTVASGDAIKVKFSVPIAGWGSSIALSSTTEARTCAAIVTGDPASATSGNPIIVPTVVYDSHGGYSASTGRYTVTLPGIYVIGGALASASAATTLSIYKNGNLYALCGNLDSNGEATFYGQVQCVSGDLIDIRPGGTVDATSMSLNIQRISGPEQVGVIETVAVEAYLNTPISLSNSTTTNLPMDTIVKDTHGSYNTSTGACTVPVSGWYAFECQVSIAANTTGSRNMHISSGAADTGTEYGFYGQAAESTGLTYLRSSKVLYLIAGSTVYMSAIQNSGGALNTGSGRSSIYFSLAKIGA